jgi:hypothetical protein
VSDQSAIPRKDNQEESHLIKNILYSKQTLMIWLRRLLIFSLFLAGVAGIRVLYHTLFPPLVYHKDLVQEYLLARAVVDGIDPYLPLPDLGARYLGSLPRFNLPHPTPHPPPIILISLPLVLFSFEQAAVIWFCFEIIMTSVAVCFIVYALDRKIVFYLVPVIIIFLIAWRPIFTDLAYGQLMTFILFLLAGAWLSFKKGKHFLAGILLGGAIAFKLVGWPVLFFFFIKKNWKSFLTTIATIAALNITAIFIMGFDPVYYYYTEVSKIISPLYRAHEGNFSLWTLGWRFFEGTGSPQVSGIIAPPLISIPELAPIISFSVPCLLLGLGLLISHRVKKFDTAFGLLICISVLVNPIFWVIYIVILLVPIVIIWNLLVKSELPKVETYIFSGISLFLFLPREIIVLLLDLFAGPTTLDTIPQISFAASLVTLLPTAAVIGLVWLIWRLDRKVQI